MSRFAANIHVAVEAEDADAAHEQIRKLVKGVERAAQEHGIETAPFANYPVETRTTIPERSPEDEEAPETLFDDDKEQAA